MIAISELMVRQVLQYVPSHKDFHVSCSSLISVTLWLCLASCVCGHAQSPSWLQPVCCAPYGAQQSAFPQNVWLCLMLRGYVAITSFPIENSNHSCDLIEGKHRTMSEPSLSMVQAAPLGMIKSKQDESFSTLPLAGCVPALPLFTPHSGFSLLNIRCAQGSQTLPSAPGPAGAAVYHGSLQIVLNHAIFWENFRITFIKNKLEKRNR